MPETNFSPRFVKARVSFNYGANSYQAGEHLINSLGIPGFAWGAFDPSGHVGARVLCTLEVLTKTPWTFQCDALITCELSATSTNTMGFQLLIAGADRTRLEASIGAEGLLPTYVRKFPRIHYMAHVPVFPSRAIVHFYHNHEDVAVCCDVDNLSPRGFQLCTDDSRAIALLPDGLVRMHLQPRGPWPIAIQFNAQIKRLIYSVDPLTNNACRYLGLAITTLTPESKTQFTDLLRQIVHQARG